MTATEYRPAKMSLWQGRVDDPSDRQSNRWHQMVEPLDLTGATLPALDPATTNVCLLGFACDEGVKRNLGRPGAAAGPVEIRRALASLPWHGGDTARLYDAGDVICDGAKLEAAQLVLAEKVEKVRNWGAFPLVLGGGHEVAYGSYLGLLRSLQSETEDKPRLGIINLDAHFDLRPLNPKPSSGTMFGQIAAERIATHQPFDYLCLGIQKTGNTPALFARADALGVHYLLAEQLQPEMDENAQNAIDNFIARCDQLYLTLCSDVIASAYAPGVSAPQPFGLHPAVVRRLLRQSASSGKLIGFDIAEVAPALDRDNQTAALAAQLIFHLLDALLAGKEGRP